MLTAWPQGRSAHGAPGIDLNPALPRKTFDRLTAWARAAAGRFNERRQVNQLAKTRFGALFRTRFTPLLAFGGVVMLTAAAALLTGLAAGQGTLVAAGSGLIGLGVGASVSPALFLAGFSLRSTQIQRAGARTLRKRGGSLVLLHPQQPVARVLALLDADQMLIIRRQPGEREPREKAGI